MCIWACLFICKVSHTIHIRNKDDDDVDNFQPNGRLVNDPQGPIQTPTKNIKIEWDKCDMFYISSSDNTDKWVVECRLPPKILQFVINAQI